MVEVVTAQCHLVDNQYQQNSEILYTFTLIKFYAYWLNVKPSNLLSLKTCNKWFTDQNDRPLEIEDKVNMTFLIK